ncbi:hypothetical protein Psta_2887 [Pirellula staleyi DSM 6068]|uniref:Uncharacterized protein n=1 Tax=Pirellula staleyi (strain ATCC 27377 / DSM 6068 / ICPB 4128) TaxID=530564 RepID=D2R8L1_PIRSD|nr:hypothetical protein [Pirellula staleyi]ADB17552.1 hypothetical protein Psta_2887 [Pirellula staleyi DSM 6068]
MVIKFLCPNNHPLTAPENLAGKAGKCPKCNTPFKVPEPDQPAGSEQSAPAADEGPVTRAELSDQSPTIPESGSGMSTAAGNGVTGPKQPAGEVFVFLCPNGHKLNGPPSLKGKAGQCPHCGERFRIPADDDPPPDDLEEIPTSEIVEEDAYEEASADGGAFSFNFGGEPSEEEPVEETYEIPEPDPFPTDVSAMSFIMGRLWDQKTEDTELDVFLIEGEIMSPEHYSEHLSTREFGVFATKESDGTFAITVIPWSAIRRVGMRKIGELPPQYFR